MRARFVDSGGRDTVVVMAEAPLTNLDLLEWFGDDERSDCSFCGRRACVRLPDAAAVFCLGCGAISIGGIRIDLGGQIPVEI